MSLATRAIETPGGRLETESQLQLDPLPHRLLARVDYLHPATSSLALGLVRTPPDYQPDELPTLLRRRLIFFLIGHMPLPHRSLRSILPVGEAADARREFQRLLRSGYTPGDAIYELGLLARKDWCNVPTWSKAEILASGCSCVSAGTHVLIASCSGTPLDNVHRVLRCTEAIATLT